MSLPKDEGKVTMEHSTMVNGRKWLLYAFDFETADGHFGSYFYALSDEHAVAILEELKATATFRGQVIGTYPA